MERLAKLPRQFGLLLLTGLLMSLVGLGRILAASPLDQAAALYNQTRYEEALRLLDPGSADPAVLFLAGKCRFMMGEFKEAANLFQRAARLEPKRSEYYHWLGKAEGRRAETSSFLTAPRYASRCREAFEKAVALEPTNLEAMNDLFEYYLEAPGFLGGGLAKAEALAEKIAAVNAVEGHWARAKLADKRKDYAKAESELRRAVELAPRQVGRLIDLARFLHKRGRFEESEKVFQRAGQLAPDSPKLLYARARCYLESGRNVEQARNLLQRFLASHLTPDDPSREEAEKLLRKASGG